MGKPRPTCAAISPACHLSQPQRRSKGFSAQTENAQLLCCRHSWITMPWNARPNPPPVDRHSSGRKRCGHSRPDPEASAS
jgi:hypothetical protein